MFADIDMKVLAELFLLFCLVSPSESWAPAGAAGVPQPRGPSAARWASCNKRVAWIEGRFTLEDWHLGDTTGRYRELPAGAQVSAAACGAPLVCLENTRPLSREQENLTSANCNSARAFVCFPAGLALTFAEMDPSLATLDQVAGVSVGLQVPGGATRAAAQA